MPIAPVAAGGAAEGLPEGLAEVAAAAQAALVGDLRNGKVGAFQQGSRLAQSVLAQVFQRGHAQVLPEYPEAGSAADVHRCRQLVYGKIPGVVLVNVHHQCFDESIRVACGAAGFHGGSGQVNECQPELGQNRPKPKLIAPLPVRQGKAFLQPSQNFGLGRVVRVQGQKPGAGGGQRKNVFPFDPAAPLPGQKTGVKHMQKLNGGLGTIGNPAAVQHIGVEKAAGAWGEQEASLGDDVLQRAAFHIEQLHRPMPVPGRAGV